MICLRLVRATAPMIVPLLTFIAICIIIYAAFLKLAARILRYSVSWKPAFIFAGIMLVIVIFGHVLALSESLATRIGYNIVLLTGQTVFGSWFFSGRATNRQGTILGWSGGLRLVTLMFAWCSRSPCRFRFFSLIICLPRHKPVDETNHVTCIASSTRSTLFI